MTARQLDEKDICIFVNFPTLKTLLLPKLKEGSEHATEQMTRNVDPSKLKLAQATLSQANNVATEFLNDAQGTTIGINLSPEGISSNMIVELTPDSYLGKLSTQVKNTDQPLLAGLPKENYLYYGGAVADGKVLNQVLTDVIAPIVKEVATLGDDGKKLADSIGVMQSALGTMTGGAAGLVAPTAALGQGSMVRVLGIYKGDSEQLKAAQVQEIDLMNQISKVFTPAQPELMKSTATPAFKTINGVKFDRIQVEVNPDNTTQDAMHLSESMSQMFGPDGLSYMIGTADPKTLVVALGIEDDLIGQTVDAARSDKDELTADLSLVDAGLPKQRTARHTWASASYSARV